MSDSQRKPRFPAQHATHPSTASPMLKPLHWAIAAAPEMPQRSSMLLITNGNFGTDVLRRFGHKHSLHLKVRKNKPGTRLQYAHLIKRHYAAAYTGVFGPLPELEDATRFPPNGKPGDAAFDSMSEADQIAVNTVFANIGKAIEAYERLLIRRNAPFDRYVAGNEAAITLEAKPRLKAIHRKRGLCPLPRDTPLQR